MNKRMWWNSSWAALVLCTVAAALPAQTFTTLVNFHETNGDEPWAPLIQGVGGDLYGTAYYGGAYSACRRGDSPAGCGTVFKITPGGALTIVYSFCSQSGCPDGASPRSGLVQATSGDVYGTTWLGGAGDGGTVFKITPSGTLRTLHSFCPGGLPCPDGFSPNGLLQAASGSLYGTTLYGGTLSNGGGGTIFEITPSGALTTLYSFSGPDGAGPNAGLIQGIDGNFYGTTSGGGAYRSGTVFQLTPSGTLTVLYSFCAQGIPYCPDGYNPYAGLVQAANGDLYGTTEFGGASTLCPAWGDASPQGCGTVFKITTAGTLTTLYTFCFQSGCPDGGFPEAALVQASGGNFYGVTAGGGADTECGTIDLPNRSCGTVFEITPEGTLTTLHRFCTQAETCSDGYEPVGGLLQATDGSFYGTTVEGGGEHSIGTVFKLAVGLGPFVKTLPTSGQVGASVRILGTNLTAATSVTFNGAAAEFTVNSAGTAISTTVPAGATTGKVQVTTPNGALLSNVNFRVAR